MIEMIEMMTMTMTMTMTTTTTTRRMRMRMRMRMIMMMMMTKSRATFHSPVQNHHRDRRSLDELQLVIAYITVR